MQRLGYYEDFQPKTLREQRKAADRAGVRPAPGHLDEQLAILNRGKKPSPEFEAVMKIVKAAPAWRLA